METRKPKKKMHTKCYNIFFCHVLRKHAFFCCAWKKNYNKIRSHNVINKKY